MSKRVDSINMNTGKAAFDNEDKVVEMADAPKFEAKATAESVEDLETFTHEGKKIYEKRKSTGDVTYFDIDGKELPSRVVDILFEQYPEPPEFNQQGGEKKGAPQVKVVEYRENGKERFADGKKPEFVSERQDYTVGDSFIATIPKEQYYVVRFLRGQISPAAPTPAAEGEKKPSG